MTGPVLMIYLEPAPYITAFVEHVRAAWKGSIDVAYVSMNRSQPWGCRLAHEGDFLLPEGLVAAIRQIGARVRSRRYALVHLAGWGHPVLLAALFIAKWHSVPVTMESDTQRPLGPAGWKSMVKKLLYPWLFSWPDMFLPGGSRQAAYLRDYRVDEARIRVAQMTVDVDAIRSRIAGRKSEFRTRFRERWRISENAACILYLGRLEPHKGVTDLLETHGIVVQERPGVVLAIVGDGSLRATVEAAASELDSIRYTGRLSGDEVLEAYCAADIFVVPSRDEPWGLVVNEAMAVGLPVIATDRVGCVDDIVHHDVTGIVLPSQSLQGTTRAIIQLVDAPDLRLKMAELGRELISGWTLRNQASQTVGVWQCVCE